MIKNRLNQKIFPFLMPCLLKSIMRRLIILLKNKIKKLNMKFKKHHRNIVINRLNKVYKRVVNIKIDSVLYVSLISRIRMQILIKFISQTIRNNNLCKSNNLQKFKNIIKKTHKVLFLNLKLLYNNK